jgi:hypothetical protein
VLEPVASPLFAVPKEGSQLPRRRKAGVRNGLGVGSNGFVGNADNLGKGGGGGM